MRRRERVLILLLSALAAALSLLLLVVSLVFIAPEVTSEGPSRMPDWARQGQLVAVAASFAAAVTAVAQAVRSLAHGRHAAPAARLLALAVVLAIAWLVLVGTQPGR